MKTRVFLINLGSRKLIFPYATPPMGLLYLAGYLREKVKDVEIKIVNQRLENYTPKEVVKIIYDYYPHILGISSSTPFAYMIPYIATKIKELLPQSWIVLGGPHASAIRKQAFRDCDKLDIVVPGEGEIAFQLIVESYPDKKSLINIPGLLWKDDSDLINENEGILPFEEELDNLPFPAYDLIDLSKYWEVKSMTLGPCRKYGSLFSSRGCPYQCMWCHSIFGKRIRFSSPERIVEEIIWLKNKYGIDYFEFLDDNFNFNQLRTFKFAEMVKKKNLKLKLSFPNALRADLITEEVADALIEAGTYISSLALETGSPRLQKFTCKRLDITKFLKAVEMMDKRKIYTHGFCMLGFPTETEEELLQTINVASESKLHTATFYTVIPFPGTPLYEWVKENKREIIDKVDYREISFDTARFNLTDIPDHIFFSYNRKAYFKFYANPRRIYRIIRTYPEPLSLLTYIPMFLFKLTKGLLPYHKSV